MVSQQYWASTLVPFGSEPGRSHSPAAVRLTVWSATPEPSPPTIPPNLGSGYDLVRASAQEPGTKGREPGGGRRGEEGREERRKRNEENRLLSPLPPNQQRRHPLRQPGMGRDQFRPPDPEAPVVFSLRSELLRVHLGVQRRPLRIEDALRGSTDVTTERCYRCPWTVLSSMSLTAHPGSYADCYGARGSRVARIRWSRRVLRSAGVIQSM